LNLTLSIRLNPFWFLLLSLFQLIFQKIYLFLETRKISFMVVQLSHWYIVNVSIDLEIFILKFHKIHLMPSHFALFRSFFIELILQILSFYFRNILYQPMWRWIIRTIFLIGRLRNSWVLIIFIIAYQILSRYNAIVLLNGNRVFLFTIFKMGLHLLHVYFIYREYKLNEI